jgi:hypothetical protein
MARQQRKISWLRWRGLGARFKNSAETAKQVDMSHVPKIFREPIRVFNDLLRKSLHSLLIL